MQGLEPEEGQLRHVSSFTHGEFPWQSQARGVNESTESTTGRSS